MPKSHSKPSRARASAPRAASATKSPAAVADTPQTARSLEDRSAAWRKLIRGLASPSAGVRARFARAISDERAVDKGDHVESLTVLDDVDHVLTRAAPFVRANQIPGYGPKRLVYVTEMALELVDLYKHHGEIKLGKLGKGAAKTDAVTAARKLRHQLGNVLGALAKGDREAERRLAGMALRDNSPSSIAAGLRDQVNEARKYYLAMTGDDAEVVADAGLTEDLVARAESLAAMIESAQSQHTNESGSLQTDSRNLNLHDGRVQFEIEHLIHLAESARRTNVAIPSMRPPHRVTHHAPAPVAAPTAAPSRAP